jgi:hypothetical protein
MPATLARPHVVRSTVLSLKEFLPPESQGADGRYIDQIAHQAVDHWSDKPSEVRAHLRESDFRYEPIPLNIVGTVRVKYRRVGRIVPKAYRR